MGQMLSLAKQVQYSGHTFFEAPHAAHWPPPWAATTATPAATTGAAVAKWPSVLIAFEVICRTRLQPGASGSVCWPFGGAAASQISRH